MNNEHAAYRCGSLLPLSSPRSALKTLKSWWFSLTQQIPLIEEQSGGKPAHLICSLYPTSVGCHFVPEVPEVQA